MSELKKSKVIGIRLDPELYREIKIRSAERNEPIKNWVTRALLEQIVREKQYEIAVDSCRHDKNPTQPDK